MGHFLFNILNNKNSKCLGERGLEVWLNMQLKYLHVLLDNSLEMTYKVAQKLGLLLPVLT